MQTTVINVVFFNPDTFLHCPYCKKKKKKIFILRIVKNSLEIGYNTKTCVRSKKKRDKSIMKFDVVKKLMTFRIME